jgi:zinc transporter, ZIP family
MTGFPLLVGLSAVMGLSIFLSMPVVFRKSMGSRTITLLNSAAIGILIFLLADLFLDVGPQIYSNPTSIYLANANYAILFAVAVAACFLVLFFAEHRSRSASLAPKGLALIIALAIGFQNLTEGLVFGSSWAVGAVGLTTVVFVGFFLQNITEGFPIASPLLGTGEHRVGLVTTYFLIGGIPTILGGVGGYFYNNATLDLIFDALAIGAILYSIIPMLRVAFRPAQPPDVTYLKQQLTYVGILLGFLIGFVVNAL